MIFQPSGGTAMVRAALLGFIFLTFAPGCLSAGCGSYVKGEVPDWIRMVNVEDKDGPKVQLGVFLDSFGFVTHKIQKVVKSVVVAFNGGQVGTNPATCSGSKVTTFTLNGDIVGNSNLLDKVTNAEPVCLPDGGTKPLKERLMMATTKQNRIQFNKVKCSSTDVQNELRCIVNPKSRAEVGAPITIFDDKESSHKLVGFVEKVGRCIYRVQLLDPATLACLSKGFGLGCGRWNGVGKTPWATNLYHENEGGLPGIVIVSPNLALSLKVPNGFDLTSVAIFQEDYFATRVASCGYMDVWKLVESPSGASDREPVCLARKPYTKGSKLMLQRYGSAAPTDCTTVSGNYECTTDNKYKHSMDLNQPVTTLDPNSRQHQLMGFFKGKTSAVGSNQFKSDVKLITDSDWKCVMRYKLNIT